MALKASPTLASTTPSATGALLDSKHEAVRRLAARLLWTPCPTISRCSSTHCSWRPGREVPRAGLAYGGDPVVSSIIFRSRPPVSSALWSGSSLR
jgi:hypothetical protein